MKINLYPATRLALVGLLIMALAQIGVTTISAKSTGRRGAESERGLRAYRDAAREPELTSAELLLLEKAETMGQAHLGSARTMLEGIVSNTDVPTNAVFYHALANIYVRIGNAEAAEVMFEQAIKRFSNFQRAWNDMGILRYVNDDYKGAVQALAKSIELGSGDSQTYGALAFCQSELGNFSAAEMSYNLALVTDPENPNWLEGKAQVLVELGRETEAVRVMRELILSDPENIEYWLLQANNWLASGERLKAARCLEIAGELGTLDSEARFLLANIYLSSGIVDLAVERFHQLIEHGIVIRPQVAVQVARRLLHEGRVEDARAIFEEAGELAPTAGFEDRVRYAIFKSDLATAEGDPSAAAELLENALKIDPLNGRLIVKLAEFYADRGERAKAYYLLERKLTDRTGKHQALVLKSRLLVEDERFKEAERTLYSAMAIRSSKSLELFYDQVKAIARSIAHAR